MQPLTLPFSAIDATLLPLVGGKAANLGEMTRAGLPVPPGFCVTTIAYSLVTEGAGLEGILDELSATRQDDMPRLEQYAAAARACLMVAPMPTQVAEAITEAYKTLGEPVAVAVRSSATAEDLPFASFAGQQDTYLNIVGSDAVLAAVRRCWASLWTDRAVSYRMSNGIDHHTVRLAVAVQQMVDAQVAGVLFTANPLTGRRSQAVIDASPGLGEAVVSGAVNPDHFIVNTVTGEIVERRLGDKRVLIRATVGGGTRRVEQAAADNQACLSDEQIRDLAALGAKVEAHYRAPQDTEWAIDASDTLWLTQARPITTLFPLPPDAPDDTLRVYLSINVVQGVYRPFTPMGSSVFRLVASSMTTFFGSPPHDTLAGPSLIKEAAYRLFVDLTPALCTTVGRTFLTRVMQVGEARSAVIFQRLATDPRLPLVSAGYSPLIRTVLHVLTHSHTLSYLVQAIFRPAAAQKRVERTHTQVHALTEVPANASASERLAKIEHVVIEHGARMLLGIPPVLLCALGAYTLAAKLLAGLASDEELQTVLRALPHNPTTEMDLELWALAQRVRADSLAAERICTTAPEQLSQDYHHKTLPPIMQQGLTDFLSTYGHRGVAEIDLGLPRWSEDPTHILGVLANYLRLEDPLLAPNVQFQHGVQQAEAMVKELTQRAKRKGRLRGMFVGFCLRRTRALAGLREAPKFYIITLIARIRELLWSIGKELARAEKIASAEDIFFITLAEVRTALNGTDMHTIVRRRRAGYAQELKRRHVPRVLLSDGTEPEDTMHIATTADGMLRGTPASAGRVTAKARVILDPIGARLEPGEILVAPSTDPGWTPLFLTASGLVMEMGGAMSHGAVVAREYGIPAVVGVDGATEHITSGQIITIDGSAGTITPTTSDAPSI